MSGIPLPEAKKSSTRSNRKLVAWIASLAAAVAIIMILVVRSNGPGEKPTGDHLPTPAWFEDITERSGIDFIHDPGSVPGNYSLPQINGSGCAMSDLDGDGRADILLLTHGGAAAKSTNKLYRQREDGAFRDVSIGSGLDFPGSCMGVAVGDINNDGRPDILITLYGGIRLFSNLGDMKFRDVSEEAGVLSRGWATSAAFLDYDRDGRLDFVVVHGVDVDPSWSCNEPDGQRGYCSPNVFPGAVSRLFHNESTGASIRFRDATLESGLGRLPGPGLGVVCADFDGDGWIDMFIADDARPNRLWINKHDGAFADEAPGRGVALNSMGQAWAGMGVALGDVDGDGAFDLLVSHLGIETNTLWVQGPRGLFRDKTLPTGLAAGGWRGTGWGIALADFNCDGQLDSVVVNGRVNRGPPVNPALGDFWSPYAERNQVFSGAGSGRFQDRSLDEPALCGVPNVARGLAVADVDNDGALDVLVTTIGDRARLYRNVCPNRGNWIRMRCLDPARGDRNVPGAELTVEANGVRRVGIADPGGSFLSSSDPRAHFGLGDAAHVDAIEVRWPDGSREAFPGTPSNREVVLRKGAGKSLPLEQGARR